jgi:hypothetical protein
LLMGHRALARREAFLIAASPGATLSSGHGDRVGVDNARH